MSDYKAVPINTVSFSDLEKEEKNCEHTEVEIYFINRAGRILMTRRSEGKKRFPGVWGPVGGRALKGETGVSACAREAKEQLGLTADMPHARLLVCHKEDNVLHEVFLLYQNVKDEELQPDPKNVAEYCWKLPEDVTADEAMGPDMEKLPTRRAVFPFVSLESMRRRIPLGHYRHFKGNEYLVQGLALHTETMEPLVIYQAMYGPGEIWVRPARMWTEQVERDGYSGPRFMLLDTEAE